MYFEDIHDLFRPKTVIEIRDTAELMRIEDVVAEHIDHDMTKRQRDNWDNRGNIANLIKPDTFHGRVADMVLATMDEPYQQLITCTERGWRRSVHGAVGKAAVREQAPDEELQRYVGFVLTASAYSSGRGRIGQLQTELYYFPPPTARTSRNNLLYGGKSINRTVLKGIIDKTR